MITKKGSPYRSSGCSAKERYHAELQTAGGERRCTTLNTIKVPARYHCLPWSHVSVRGREQLNLLWIHRNYLLPIEYHHRTSNPLTTRRELRLVASMDIVHSPETAAAVCYPKNIFQRCGCSQFVSPAGYTDHGRLPWVVLVYPREAHCLPCYHFGN